MEEKKKKKKLTLTVSSKKPHSVPHYVQNLQSKGKTSVVIEKKSPRRWNEKKFQPKDSFSKSKPTSDFVPKKTPIDKNFNIRKRAEEQATRRFRNLKEDSLQQKKAVWEKKKFLHQKENTNLLCQKLWMMKLWMEEKEVYHQ